MRELIRRGALWGALAGLSVEGAGANWDIAWHGDVGRDRFLTPPHVLILVGIFLVGGASVLGLMAFGGWRARLKSPGLVVAATVSALQGLGLIVDNWWHGIFGVDVTLWSPPHLLLLALGFLALVALMAEYASRPAPKPRALATWAGGLLGSVTILLAEYDFGYPHFGLVWSTPVLAACFGVGVGLARAASGLRWAGTIAVFVGLTVRLVSVALNVVVNRSLPVPPLGILIGGVVFDVVLLSRARRDTRPTGGELAMAAAIAWVVTFPFQTEWSRIAGKTWLPSAVVVPAVVLGLVAAPLAAVVGSRVGRGIRRAELGAPAWGESQGGSRPAAVALVAAAAGLLVVIGVTFRPVAVGAVGASGVWVASRQQATVALTGDRVTVSIRGGHDADWVSVFAQPSRRGQGLQWIGGLTSRGPGSFVGRLRHPDRPLVSPGGAAFHRVGFWFVSGNGAWFGGATVVDGRPATPFALFKATSHPPRPVAAWLTPFGYVVVLSILAAATGLAIAVLGRGEVAATTPSVT